MKPSTSLSLNQRVSLTPQQQQSLKILQLNSQELDLFIRDELESNPLLEEQVAHDEQSERIETLSNNDTSSKDLDFQELPIILPDTDFDSASYWHDRQPAQLSRLDSDADFDPFAKVSKATSLVEHLESQLATTTLNQRERVLATAILHHLDEDGYLHYSANEIAQNLWRIFRLSAI